MQCIIRKLAWVMQVTMATTAAESLNAAANIFVGMVIAYLVWLHRRNCLTKYRHYTSPESVTRLVIGTLAV